MDSFKLSHQHQRELLNVARASIYQGLLKDEVKIISSNCFDTILQEKLASFVTLTINDQLRGCIGSLQAVQPLVHDVAKNAHSAAFHDPRFSPINELEFYGLKIKMAILSSPKEMKVSTETELLDALRPNVDGLILVEKNHQSTFLPMVWESLPEKKDFLSRLKIKAGLPQNYWSQTITFFNYTTFSFEETTDQTQ